MMAKKRMRLAGSYMQSKELWKRRIMKQQRNFDISTVPIWKVVIVITSDPDYSMNRVMLVEDFPAYRDYVLLTGEHCSCIDFDEVEWDATFGNIDEIRTIVKNWQEHGDYAEILAAPVILRYLAR